MSFEKWLQRQLNLAGATPKLDEDGVVGRLTIEALRQFQIGHNLMITGVADQQTVDALRLRDSVGDVSELTAPERVPPWYSLAMTKMGLQEKRNKAELEKFLKSDGNTLGDPSKLPWCGDFVETCVAVSLPKEVMVTNPYYALNWLKFGKSIPTSEVYRGAIAIFKRTGGGHVGFVAGHDANYVHVLGGNQSNSVSIARVAKSRLQGYRWPKTYPLSQLTERLAPVSFDATVKLEISTENSEA